MLHIAYPALGTGDGWGGGTCSAGDIPSVSREPLLATKVSV